MPFDVNPCIAMSSTFIHVPVYEASTSAKTMSTYLYHVQLLQQVHVE